MADNMKLKVVAPERIFYEGEASFLEFTTTEGDMGIYPNHIPLTAIIAPGVLRIHENGQVKEAALLSGFIQILQEEVTILAESVEWPDEIDVERAQAAKARAEERLANKTEAIDVARAELALRRALVRMDIAK